MRDSHKKIITALGVIAAVGTIIGLLKVFFDDTPIFFVLSGITIGIILTIVTSELIERFTNKKSGPAKNNN